MEEVNLIPDEKLLKIGNKEINVARISAERSLIAAALYNKKIKGNFDKESGEYLKYESEYELVLALLDCVFILVRIDFKLSRIMDWLKRITITKKYILKTIDHKVIMDFIEEALEPIIGDKKKELNRQNKMTDAMLILMDNLTPEALAQLLLNSAPTPVTQKTTA